MRQAVLQPLIRKFNENSTWLYLPMRTVSVVVTLESRPTFMAATQAFPSLSIPSKQVKERHVTTTKCSLR